MIVLDTDHFSELIRGRSVAGRNLAQRLHESTEPYCTTIVTYEEQMRGGLEKIHKERDVHRRFATYGLLRDLLESFTVWTVLDWNADAAKTFDEMRSSGVNIGTMDLKIASIALIHQSTVLSRNLKDFGRVPGLIVEDWLSLPSNEET